MDLEKIPNPEGYWVPIENRDAFAQQFANAAGEEITTVRKYGIGDYYTTNGKINVMDFFLRDYAQPSVHYLMYDSFSLVSESDQLPFINNFMNSMGFKLANEKFSIPKDFFETCGKNYFWSVCTLNDNSTIFKYVDGGYTHYLLTTQYSEIKFRFSDKAYVMKELAGLSIKFNGWTNHPELVQHPLGEKAANDIIRDYILSTEYFSKLGSDGGTCEVQLESIAIHRVVIFGVPFYESEVVNCTLFLDNTGMKDWTIILIDGWTGEHIFRSFQGGQG